MNSIEIVTGSLIRNIGSNGNSEESSVPILLVWEIGTRYSPYIPVLSYRRESPFLIHSFNELEYIYISSFS